MQFSIIGRERLYTLVVSLERRLLHLNDGFLRRLVQLAGYVVGVLIRLFGKTLVSIIDDIGGQLVPRPKNDSVEVINDYIVLLANVYL